jgi:predicted peptidase
MIPIRSIQCVRVRLWNRLFVMLVVGAAPLMLAARSAAGAEAVPQTPGFHRLTFQAKVQTEQGPKSVRMAYLLYLPVGYDGSKVNPALIFLHGAGECGTDLEGVFVHGPAMELSRENNDAFIKSFPFVLICPQCPPRGQRWDQSAMIKGVVALLDQVSDKLRIDKDRVYVTGLSMGGKGTWMVAMEAPDRFAAIAPLAADTLDTQGVARLKNVSVWAIAGADDWFGTAQNSEKMVDILKAAGGDALMTKVPGVGHWVWPQYYADSKFYDWFLKHKRHAAEERRQGNAAAHP